MMVALVQVHLIMDLAAVVELEESDQMDQHLQVE
jgi:hypothetical protein